MKNAFRISVVVFSLFGGALAISQMANAFEPRMMSRVSGFGGGMRGPDPRQEFVLGACVGQILAQQGVTLSVSQLEQPPESLDAPTEGDLKAAVESCRTELQGGASPSPSPSPSPSDS
jgi:hypothetical protein